MGITALRRRMMYATMFVGRYFFRFPLKFLVLGVFSVFGNNVFVIGELSNCLLCVFSVHHGFQKCVFFVPVIPF